MNKQTEDMMEEWDEFVSEPLPVKLSVQVDMKSDLPVITTVVQAAFDEPKKKKKKIKSTTVDTKKRNKSSLF